MRPRNVAAACFTTGSLAAIMELMAQMGFRPAAQWQYQPEEGGGDKDVHREVNAEPIAPQEWSRPLHNLVCGGLAGGVARTRPRVTHGHGEDCL